MTGECENAPQIPDENLRASDGKFLGNPIFKATEGNSGRE
jgi:hypothetical protein